MEAGHEPQAWPSALLVEAPEAMGFPYLRILQPHLLVVPAMQGAAAMVMTKVTQSARDAAEPFRRGIGGKYDRDHSELVQAFAAAEARGHARSDAERDALVAALPARIGRLELGERMSSDHYCGGSHDLPDGQPIYWQQRGGEYPDDIDGYCLACAIDQAESEAGWCECPTRAAQPEAIERPAI